MLGGHGEWFVAEYDRPGFAPITAIDNLAPAAAASQIDVPLVVGSAAEELIALRGSGEAFPLLPRAAHALRLPPALRSLEPRPVYARAPDARPLAAA